MASITTRPVGAGSSVVTVLTGLAGRIIAWNDARITRNALAGLTDHQLDDLGLVRGDIDSIADEYRQAR